MDSDLEKAKYLVQSPRKKRKKKYSMQTPLNTTNVKILLEKIYFEVLKIKKNEMIHIDT